MNVHTYPASEEPSAPESDCYMHVRNPRSGRDWIVEFADDRKIDPESLLRDMMGRVPEFMPESLRDVTRQGFGGDLQWTVYLDGQQPFSAHCWTSGEAWTQPVHV